MGNEHLLPSQTTTDKNDDDIKNDNKISSSSAAAAPAAAKHIDEDSLSSKHHLQQQSVVITDTLGTTTSTSTNNNNNNVNITGNSTKTISSLELDKVEQQPLVTLGLEKEEEEAELEISTTSIMAPSGSKPTPGQYQALVASFFLYSIVVGYYAATRPTGKFRSPFSYHPLLMTLGMVGCMGTAAITKKLGGYTNTKNHGLIANLGVLLAIGGLYAIYHNKNLMERPHFTSYHGKAGIALVVASIGAGMAGGIFLHPDFGIDKTNQTIRFAHKNMARVVLGCAWMTAFMGMYTMTQSMLDLVLFGLPLIVFAPFTLM